MDSFRGFSKWDQLRNVAAELYRAHEWQDDPRKVQGAIQRAMELVDRMLRDPQWADNLRLPLLLRQELARVYIAEQPAAAVLALI